MQGRDPAAVIEAEFEDEVFEIGRQMLAERDWEDWQVAEVDGDHDSHH